MTCDGLCGNTYDDCLTFFVLICGGPAFAQSTHSKPFHFLPFRGRPGGWFFQGTHLFPFHALSFGGRPGGFGAVTHPVPFHTLPFGGRPLGFAPTLETAGLRGAPCYEKAVE